MRRTIGWLLACATALALATALMPATAHAQDNYNYEVPPSSTAPFLPIGHYRMEEGGFFVGLDFVYWRMTNPLWTQTVAYRGFMDSDGSITGTVGQFVGSHDVALNTGQVSGPGTYAPGLNYVMGWRFDNGMVLEASWIHLAHVGYTAQATLVPQNFLFGGKLENTFLFSPVFNFDANWAGEPKNVNKGNDGATFGIWNAAGFMQIEFLQRFEQIDMTLRVPAWSTYNSRSYGLIGPELVWIWERFKWRTVSQDLNGLSVASDVADFSNIVSNRLYGVHAGYGYECFLGDTPIGGFALSVEAEGGMFVDLVKTRAIWNREDRAIAAHRTRSFATLAPAVFGNFKLWWYPLEAVQVNLGYDAEAFFNTMASRHPIDFDMSSITPGFDKDVFRLFHGLRFGVSITF